MDTRDLPLARTELEERLRVAIAEIVDGFKADTGISVSGVDVSFVDVSTFDDVSKSLMVSSVEVELSL